MWVSRVIGASMQLFQWRPSGIEREVKADLEGLSFQFGAPLMPHPNIRRWVEAQLQAAGFR